MVVVVLVVDVVLVVEDADVVVVVARVVDVVVEGAVVVVEGGVVVVVASVVEVGSTTPVDVVTSPAPPEHAVTARQIKVNTIQLRRVPTFVKVGGFYAAGTRGRRTGHLRLPRDDLAARLNPPEYHRAQTSAGSHDVSDVCERVPAGDRG